MQTQLAANKPIRCVGGHGCIDATKHQSMQYRNMDARGNVIQAEYGEVLDV